MPRLTVEQKLELFKFTLIKLKQAGWRVVETGRVKGFEGPFANLEQDGCSIALDFEYNRSNIAHISTKQCVECGKMFDMYERGNEDREFCSECESDIITQGELEIKL